MPQPATSGNSCRDAVGGGLNGIVGEVGIARRGLDVVVTEQLSDHGEALADEQAAAGEAVPQVVDAQVLDCVSASSSLFGVRAILLRPAPVRLAQVSRVIASWEVRAAE